MCQKCGRSDIATRSLREGVVGGGIVRFFETELNETAPINAEYLDGSLTKDGQVNYRLTFPDETVADYHVTFENMLEVVAIEKYNQVI